MDKNQTIQPFHKVFVNISLIVLGITANTTFFSLIVTFLLGTSILGLLNSQREKFALKSKTISKEKELEKIPTASGSNSK